MADYSKYEDMVDLMMIKNEMHRSFGEGDGG
jgi:hypothetical protein